jgi:hypothetical protein
MAAADQFLLPPSVASFALDHPFGRGFFFVFLEGTLVLIPGTFVLIPGTLVLIQGTFGLILGTFVLIPGHLLLDSRVGHERLAR